MKNFKIIFFCILALLLLSVSNLLHAYKQVSCVTHIHSTFSDSGKLSLEQIIKKAKDYHVDVVIPTDHDLEKIEYGLWPFRKIIKKTVEKNSVFLIGTDKYLAEIKRLQEKYPEIIIIPGVESSAYHYWTGSPFTKNLVLRGWHKHMTIIGLDTAEKYKKLPIINNPSAREFDPLLLWPVLLLLLGLLISGRPKVKFCFIAISLLLLIYNFPFKNYPFNAYSTNLGELPYQNLINYVNTQNGLVFWAHPEARNWKEPYSFWPVSLQSSPYPEILLTTRDFTGFAYFWEGANMAGNAGGYWDQALIEYCENKRKKPEWAIGELDYINDGVQNNYLNLNKNILLVDKLTKENALDALRKGRFYVTSKYKPNGFEPVLTNFTIKSAETRVTFGESLHYRGKVKIFFTISTSDNSHRKLKTRFIEDGKIINTITKESPANIEFEFQPVKNHTYCRIEIDMENSTKLVTNPIFLYND
ncbi:MAG: PHP domain-containing protein [Elusimicrobia bacterium]|nr:PHP domain-containing protein [Elusimicrobiota bacterium]MBU2614340.1 PHP domain-containing protein [Elusimicrobiota bacterium]